MSKAVEMTRQARASEFKLQFDPAKIGQLAQRYDYKSDDDPLAAGARIASGDYGRSNIETIFEWKTNGSGRSRLSKNSDEEIADALRLAAHAKTERAAIAVLVGLHGVHVPVASAILTAIDPARYTVIDFRALEALGSESKDRAINFYLAYLDICRKLAKRHKVTLRNLDRALWQWSSERRR
jgi:hypothetical protein